MKIMRPVLAILVAGLLSMSASARESAQEATNIKSAKMFYEAAINRKEYDAARRYLGDDYVQHNPNVKSGIDGFKELVAFLKDKLPDYHAEIRQAWADDNFVILHVLSKANPADRGSAVVDIFRFEKGKIVEHWDVIQTIPEKSANDNSMF